ncbi:S1-like domain-containing RNA-binding protein [Marinilabilia sp.]|uniref:CvfB family protein n=1 Tax=Marinilabilia sp. TaxID=2021252 RepID=UPI0025B7BC37|nr:S1-like domain-containing RNA-binding protein [Marinilabilia sp.]
MIQIGQYNKLQVAEMSQFGAFLDGGNLGNILLPNRYVTPELKPGQEIEVFIYLDSEDRLVAITDHPLVTVGQFAYLQVNDVTNVGAFLDWGLPKDLLVPFREQKLKMAEGNNYLVYVYLDDETNRIVASAKIEKFLDNVSPQYQPGEKVDLIIAGVTDLGYKAIINQTHSGLIYKNQTDQSPETGQQMPGYIIRIREDEKIDLSLTPVGTGAITDNVELLWKNMELSDGFLPLTDNSSPDEIKGLLQMSKKAFKKAVGSLYKQGKILIEQDGIRVKRP